MSLIDVLDHAPDPKIVRFKLRSLLGQLVESIWVLVVPLTKAKRVAAVQVHFEGDRHRDFLILCQSAGHNRKGGWQAMSFAKAGLAGGLDLRKPDHARRLEKALLTFSFSDVRGRT
jgi:hypothetical protein